MFLFLGAKLGSKSLLIFWVKIFRESNNNTCFIKMYYFPRLHSYFFLLLEVEDFIYTIVKEKKRVIDVFVSFPNIIIAKVQLKWPKPRFTINACYHIGPVFLVQCLCMIFLILFFPCFLLTHDIFFWWTKRRGWGQPFVTNLPRRDLIGAPPLENIGLSHNYCDRNATDLTLTP